MTLNEFIMSIVEYERLVKQIFNIKTIRRRIKTIKLLLMSLWALHLHPVAQHH